MEKFVLTFLIVLVLLGFANVEPDINELPEQKITNNSKDSIKSKKDTIGVRTVVR